MSGNTNTIVEITQRINQDLKQKQNDADLKRQLMKSWQKLVSSGFFKGSLMFLPAVLYGSFSFATLKGFINAINGTASAPPQVYAIYQSRV